MSLSAEHAARTPEDADLPLAPEEFRHVAAAIQREVASVIVGQEEAIHGTLLSLIAGGHVLLEGVPGLGKTSLVRAFAQVISLQYGRIQFTPDLMPADITGTSVLMEDASGRRSVTFQPGPIFANLILADEINRATPKTQSALLEAMQEGTVTLANAMRPLPEPFCVLATENPIEMQGTYPLPEAQLDRFFLKLYFVMPDKGELIDILYRTADFGLQHITPVADGTMLLRMRRLARSVPMARHVVDYAARLVLALQPGAPGAIDYVRRYIRVGASPRGAQTLCLAGRIEALLAGRFNLAFADIRTMARPALRHRIVLSFDAQRQGITPDAIIDQVVAQVPEEV
jgi:MoxR-like ATPase